VAVDADALTILTEWNEFKQLDLARIRESMRQPIVVDGRNIYDPARMRQLGFSYLSVGRPGSNHRARESERAWSSTADPAALINATTL
jgi:UDPglucose 6-dehydrogenase